MEKVICNFCSSEEYKFIASSKDYLHNTSSEIFTIVECIKCGLCYTNPRPKENDMDKYYSTNYSFFGDENIFRILYHLFFIIISKSRFLCSFLNFIPFFRKKIILHLKPKKMKNPQIINNNEYFLDIGSGSGIGYTHWWGRNGSLKTYYKNNKNIYAVEPNKESHKILKKYTKESYLSIDEIPLSLKFDKIRLNWSLEHVHNPQKFFSFLSNKLKSTGDALICIPNFGGHIYQIDPSNSELPIHLFHFKYKNILDYCNKNKLEIIFFKTFSYSSMYYLSSLLFEHNYFKKFYDMPINDLRDFQNELDLIDKNNNGNDMVIKIKKKI